MVNSMNDIRFRTMIMRKDYIDQFRERIMWYWPHLLPRIDRPDVIALEVTEKEYSSILHFRNGFMSAISLLEKGEHS